MAVKFEFMSPEWIAMAREEITRALAGRDLGAVPFRLCEAFTNPPAHLRRDGADRVGFCLRVGGGPVEVADRPAADADCTIVSDYGDALTIARDPEAASADPAEAARRIAAGRLQVVGDFAAAPAALRELDLHRLLAARTA